MWGMKRKIKIIILAVAIVLLIYFVSWQLDFSQGKEPSWGATFSQYYAQELLKMDWQKTYESILNDFNFKKLRSVAYWQYLEPKNNQFNFSDLDWQINEAEKTNKEVILVIGYRVPRWPECHAPEWSRGLNKEEWQKEFLGYLQNIVEHYKTFEGVKAWQVENEPLLSVFGNCPPPDIEFLKKEIALVKSLDPSRPIIITDSGELSLWFRTAPLSDILGTTLYRTVWNKIIGSFKHFYPPVAYTLRSYIARKVFGAKDVIISELQAEPWASGGGNIAEVAFEKQTQSFDLKQLENNLEFARKTGIKEIYLWGVEWWYWRQAHGDSDWLELGKNH